MSIYRPHINSVSVSVSWYICVALQSVGTLYCAECERELWHCQPNV